MDLTKLVTLGFDKNVGSADRVFRLVSGASLVAAGWYLDVPTWARVVLAVIGVMWTATGVLSKCSIYYAVGYSSCPARQTAPPR